MKKLLIATTLIATVVVHASAHAESPEINALKEQYKSSSQQENKAFIEQQKAARQNFIEERKAKRQDFKSAVKSIHEGNVAERKQKRDAKISEHQQKRDARKAARPQ